MPKTHLKSHATIKITKIIVSFAKKSPYVWTVAEEKKNVRKVKHTPSSVPLSGGVNSSSVAVMVVTVSVGSAVVVSVSTANTDTLNSRTRHKTAQNAPTIDLIRFNVYLLNTF